MKTPGSLFTAAAIPLLLASLPAIAGELPFNAPDTARAQESAQLLHQAARSLGEGDLSAAAVPAARNRYISNLWIFPTTAADTVFAQYEVRSGEGAPGSKHLVVLRLRGERILEKKELIDARVSAANEQRTVTPHWTASIGTGHVFSAGSTTSIHGAPATPHWTARIGTGTAAANVDTTESKRPSPSHNQSAVADTHWTSRIGTGHANESKGQGST